MMDSFDDRLDEAASALRERLPDIDASLDDRVMAAIRHAGTPVKPLVAQTRRGGFGWLLTPRPMQVRPVWLALAAAAVLTLLALPRGAVAPQPGTPVAAAPAAAAADTVYVHFALSAPTAHEVAVAGTFNNWDAAALHLKRGADGTWEATVALPLGEHRYQFVVDGARWVADPSAQSQSDDGFGGTNSVIVVGPKGVVRS